MAADYVVRWAPGRLPELEFIHQAQQELEATSLDVDKALKAVWPAIAAHRASLLSQATSLPIPSRVRQLLFNLQNGVRPAVEELRQVREALAGDATARSIVVAAIFWNFQVPDFNAAAPRALVSQSSMKALQPPGEWTPDAVAVPLDCPRCAQPGIFSHRGLSWDYSCRHCGHSATTEKAWPKTHECCCAGCVGLLGRHLAERAHQENPLRSRLVHVLDAMQSRTATVVQIPTHTVHNLVKALRAQSSDVELDLEGVPDGTLVWKSLHFEYPWAALAHCLGAQDPEMADALKVLFEWDGQVFTTRQYRAFGVLAWARRWPPEFAPAYALLAVLARTNA